MCVASEGKQEEESKGQELRMSHLDTEPGSSWLVELLLYSLGPQQTGEVAKHLEHLIPFGRDVL